MRLLCLSDIHGHADALGAVLAAAERRGYARVLVAGDSCFPGPEPLRTWRRLTQLGAVCVQGVGDRALSTVDPSTLRPRDAHERARLQRLLEVRDELGQSILRQLAALPWLARQPLGDGRQLALVHGSPRDPLEPMTHDMPDDLLAHLVADEPAALVLCGGSHVPFDRTVARVGQAAGLSPAVRIVNLGSVGEAPGQGEQDELRLAHATFVAATDGGIEVEQFVVSLGRAAGVLERSRP